MDVQSSSLDRIPLDEATTEAGDEHTRQITAVPQASRHHLKIPSTGTDYFYSSHRWAETIGYHDR